MKVTWVDEEERPVFDEVVSEAVESSIPDEEPVWYPPVEDLCVTRGMVGKILTRSVRNDTGRAWKTCYPGAFWMKDGERLLEMAVKTQCIGDIQAGTQKMFQIVVPRFPLDERPDALRIAILEDGVRWHVVEDIRAR